MSSHFELPTLKQEDFMLLGKTFHHLYSYPNEGSVPAGHAWHSGWTKQSKSVHSRSNILWSENELVLGCVSVKAMLTVDEMHECVRTYGAIGVCPRWTRQACGWIVHVEAWIAWWTILLLSWRGQSDRSSYILHTHLRLHPSIQHLRLQKWPGH